MRRGRAGAGGGAELFPRVAWRPSTAGRSRARTPAPPPGGPSPLPTSIRVTATGHFQTGVVCLQEMALHPGWVGLIPRI